MVWITLENEYKKYALIVLKTLVVIFAVFGFGLSFSYLAIFKQWTNESGSVDINNRKFVEVSEPIARISDSDTNSAKIEPHNAAFIAYKLMILERYFPKNAKIIMKVLEDTGDFELVNKMIQAVNIKTLDSVNLESAFNKQKELFYYDFGLYSKNTNAFEWFNLQEWGVLKQAIIKDKPLIDSVGLILGIEPRLIAMVLIGEQIRLFNSEREIFKRALMPLKILSVGNMISFGVTGIKEFTAKDVERNLKDEISPFYLGKYYENIIQFKTDNPDAERMENLVNYKNHFYSYLYAGLILFQIREQWRRAGYDISNRPEILATLFNVGFRSSKPKSNPVVGGSRITVGEREYTFGGIGFEFYYSGELLEEFPYIEGPKFNLKTFENGL